jgi:hypothetical protein
MEQSVHIFLSLDDVLKLSICGFLMSSVPWFVLLLVLFGNSGVTVGYVRGKRSTEHNFERIHYPHIMNFMTVYYFGQLVVFPSVY